MTTLYLIKRGSRPEYHQAPFHPVLICDRKRVAEWEVGWTGDGATMWLKPTARESGMGWLLVRWNGFEINYGHVVRSCLLPDGTEAGFYREYEDRSSVKDLFDGAIWWSDRPMPEWLKAKGVVYPPDQFTQQSILDSIADDGCSGFGRALPSYWPEESL